MFVGSGIFSPLAANTTSSDVRQHPVGGPAYSPTEFTTTKTTAEPSSLGEHSHTDPYLKTTDDSTPRSIDRQKQKFSDLREIRSKLDVPESSEARLEPVPTSLRLANESSPTVSRHSSNSSDIRPWPDSEASQSEGRARLEGRSADGYQGDVNHQFERGSARSVSI